MPSPHRLKTHGSALHRAILEVSDSLSDFCREHNLQRSLISGLATGNIEPVNRWGDWITPAREVAAALGVLPEDIFPTSIGLEPAVWEDLPPEARTSPEIGVERAFHEELGLTVSTLLGKLTEREAAILTLLFGLNGGVEQSAEEVAESYGVTQERINQIALKAIRRLRHPTRSNILRPFLRELYR